MLKPKTKLWLGRIPACLVVSIALGFGVASIWFDSFTWELFGNGLYLMPSRIGGNWVQVVFLSGIFAIAQLLTLRRDGWKLAMTKRLLENIGISVLSSVVGWVGLFFYSSYLEKRKIELVDCRKVTVTSCYASNWVWRPATKSGSHQSSS
jgi:hypothetical protein